MGNRIASMSVTTSLNGLADTIKAMDQLPRDVRKRVLKSAISRGCKILLRKVEATVPVDQGTLKRGMTSKVGISRKVKDAVFGVVGATFGVARHDHLVEMGTKDRRRPKAKKVLYSKRLGKFFGESTGAMPASHFMERSFNATKSQIEAEIRAKILKGIERDANKVAARKAGLK